MASPAQDRALTVAHTSREGTVRANERLGGGRGPGSTVSRPTLRALAAAGLVELVVQERTVHTTPGFGRRRARRQETAMVARPTVAGTERAVEVLGLPGRVECVRADCWDLVTTADGFCGAGCANAVVPATG